MIDPRVDIVIVEENTVIPPTIIQGFQLYSNIHEAFTTGFLVLADQEGRLLSELAMRPGSLVAVVSQDDRPNAGNFTTRAAFTPLVIVSVENIDPATAELQVVNYVEDSEAARTATLGGSVLIRLVHPWAIFSDWSNKAWEESTKISKIVN